MEKKKQEVIEAWKGLAWQAPFYTKVIYNGLSLPRSSRLGYFIGISKRFLLKNQNLIFKTLRCLLFTNSVH